LGCGVALGLGCCDWLVAPAVPDLACCDWSAAPDLGCLGWLAPDAAGLGCCDWLAPDLGCCDWLALGCCDWLAPDLGCCDWLAPAVADLACCDWLPPAAADLGRGAAPLLLLLVPPLGSLPPLLGTGTSSDGHVDTDHHIKACRRKLRTQSKD
jgi:hypothetical protein